MTSLVLSWNEWVAVAEKVMAKENPKYVRVYLTTPPHWISSEPSGKRIRLACDPDDDYRKYLRWFDSADVTGKLPEALLDKTFPGVEFVL